MPVIPDIRWIDSADALDDACQALSQAPVLALDTEFFREKTFHPVPALIQIYGGDATYLIDPLEVACTERCRQLLTNDALKLLHASSEDLEVFGHWAGVAPTPLVDTQVAQGLLGEDAAMGYQRLVEFWVGETLPKEETRSNWLERPLSDSQLSYAALDVVYLLMVWQHQRESLERHGRLEWVLEDCTDLVAQSQRSSESDGQWYLRQRQLWRLAPRQVEAYRLMTTWREGEARARDLPRNWVIQDRVLYAIAEKMPANRHDLAAVEGVKPTLIKREGDNLLAMVKQAAHREASELAPAPLAPTLPPFKSRMKALKKVVNLDAESLGVAPEVLLRRRELEALVTASLRNQPLPLPGGWRGERLNERLEGALGELAQAG
ncbi:MULTISPECIES: ribonuclease D [unclassified Halomonas]|uniref:ribonuclease D n=1 Tax=unclassified Halomonas TaxID=2609666 RepID=UPI000C9708DF|nr:MULTISPECIES: ribonuclease D [unclassified Halomonas]MAR71841.1 ribonuclease D [Halomonas sp.]|tara:strand:- start:1319 stop:2452 length:1134 start_codon:yes stop_codon:yes gene_type:complete